MKTKTGNIISLIGMTGSGKTTVGKKLAKILNCRFIDLDEAITQRENKTPREIFDVHGEKEFRKIESEELGRIISESAGAYNTGGEKLILSCGGGIVLTDENRELLKKYSYVVWLDRPVGEIIKNEDIMNRPPVNGNIENYIRLRREREHLYVSVCDIKIDSADIDETCKKIAEEINTQ